MFVLVGNVGRDGSSDYPNFRREHSRLDAFRKPTGRDHCPVQSISDDMPESGGGGEAIVADGQGGAAEQDDGGDADPDPEPRRRNPSISRSSADSAPPSGRTTPPHRRVRIDSSPPECAEQRNATATAGAPIEPLDFGIALWRLPTVLAHIPVSRSGWWAGVRTGRYPAPVRLSTRCVAWRAADIRKLIQSL